MHFHALMLGLFNACYHACVYPVFSFSKTRSGSDIDITFDVFEKEVYFFQIFCFFETGFQEGYMSCAHISCFVTRACIYFYHAFIT